MKKILLCLCFVILASGCSSLPPVENFSLPVGSRVGVIVVAEKFPKHTHVGTTIFNNFVKEYPYDWDIQDAIFNLMSETIKAKTGLETVNLRDIGLTESDTLNFVDIQEDAWAYVADSQELREILVRQGINVIIKVVEVPSLAVLNCSQFGCAEHYSSGYGLFTRSFLGMDNYLASASFNIEVESLTPPVELSRLGKLWGLRHFSKRNALIESFNDPADFKNITELEMEPVKENILLYIEEVTLQISEYLNGDL